MSTSSMGWQPVQESPEQRMTTAIATRLLEAELQKPEDEWRRALEEKKFGLAEREVGTREKGQRFEQGLAERQFGSQGEEFGEKKRQFGLDYELRTTAQESQHAVNKAQEKKWSLENELGKTNAAIKARHDEMDIEMKQKQLDEAKRMNTARINFQDGKLTIEGVKYASQQLQKVIEEEGLAAYGKEVDLEATGMLKAMYKAYLSKAFAKGGPLEGMFTSKKPAAYTEVAGSSDKPTPLSEFVRGASFGLLGTAPERGVSRPSASREIRTSGDADAGEAAERATLMYKLQGFGGTMDQATFAELSKMSLPELKAYIKSKGL